MIGETSTNYYVLPHPILRDGRYGEISNNYHVLSHYIPWRTRFSLKTGMGPTRSYWGNPYYSLCASPSGRVIGEPSTIYYVLPHSILGTGVTGKPLLITMCFPIELLGRTLRGNP